MTIALPRAARMPLEPPAPLLAEFGFHTHELRDDAEKTDNRADGSYVRRFYGSAERLGTDI